MALIKIKAIHGPSICVYKMPPHQKNPENKKKTLNKKTHLFLKPVK